MSLHDLASAPGGGGAWQSPAQPTFRGIVQHSGVPQVENPYLLGGIASVAWRDIEPANGVFNWDPVERVIRLWASHGKRAAIQVLISATPKVTPITESWDRSAAMRSRSGPLNDTLPDWLINLGVPQAPGGTGSASTHQYWNPVFLSACRRMVNELGSRFDGRPEILWTYAAVGCDGRTALEDSTPLSSASGPARGILWGTVGYTEARWLETVCSMLSFYRAAFEVTPTVAQITHPFLRQPEERPGRATVYVRESGCTTSAVSELLTYARTMRMWVEFDCRSTDFPPAEPEWRSGTMVVNPRHSASQQGRPVMADLHRIVSMGASYALVHATDLSSPRNYPALEWASKGATY